MVNSLIKSLSEAEQYVNTINPKLSCKVATNVSGTLNSDFESGDTIDGIVLSAGDRILIKDQDDGSENGIYVVNTTGSPTRSTDMGDSETCRPNSFVFIEEGTTNADRMFHLTTNGVIIIDNTILTFEEYGISGVTSITPGDGIMGTDTTGDITLSLDVDDTTLEINASGEASAKTAPVANGASTLATGDQIYDYVTTNTVLLTTNQTVAGSKTFSDSMIINDNLTINSSTTTINSDDLIIKDPLIKIADGNSTDNVDIGFYGEYNSKYSGLIRNSTDEEWYLFKDSTDNPPDSSNLEPANLNSNLNGGIIIKVTAKSDLVKGNCVYIHPDTDNDTTYVDKANASVTSKMPSFGLALKDINTGEVGYIITLGNILNISTTDVVETGTGITLNNGDVCYVSASESGKITNVPPSSESNRIQNIGKVIRLHNSSVTLRVGGVGRTNATPALNEGYIFMGNASDNSVSKSFNTALTDENVVFTNSSQTLTNKTLTSAVLNTGVSGTAIKDEYDMASDSSTHVATQKSIKAYIDGQTYDNVSNANLLQRLQNLESVNGSETNENIIIGSSSGDTLVITGNLQVSGTTTTVNSTTVDINDFNIRLNSGNNTNAVLNNAGITLEGGTGDDLTWAWNSSSSNMELKIGSQYANMTVNELTGDVKGNSNTATRLENSITINDVFFDGYTDITVPAAGTTLTDTVPIAKGGTGATTASEARTALGAASGTDNSTDVTLANTNYLSLSGQEITGGTVPISSGGTGATTASEARTALGAASGTDNSTDVTLASVTDNYLSINSSQVITSGTVPVSLGGTGASSFTSNAVLTGNGTSAIQSESNLTFDGSNLNVSGSISVSGHIIPNASNTYDLGNASYYFRDLYLSGSTINLGGTKISTNNSGDIELMDTNDNPKKLMVDEIIIGTGTDRISLSQWDNKLKLGKRGTSGTGDIVQDTLDIIDGGTGQTTYNNGELLIGNGNNTLSKSTLTHGDNISIINGSGSITISSTDTTYSKSDFDLDHLFTLLGADSHTDEHFNTFSGSIISDNRTVKQALQELETRCETAASSSILGSVKIGYTENGKNYPVDLDSEKMFVNVPWTDTTYSVGDGGLTQNNFTTTLKSKLDGIAEGANNYSLPLSVSGTRGGVQIGYTENGQNYPVELDSEKMFVNVPWTDNNTTYSNGTGLDLTGTTFSVNSDVVLLTGSQTLTDKTFVSAALGTPTSGILTNCTGTASGLTVGNSTISGTCSGNAATATALQSARTINGVSFDGTGNITIAAPGTTLSDIVPIIKGGTGQTSFIDGELLIGNSSGNTLTKNTLTGGTGITITNGSGSITISSSSSTTLSFGGNTGTTHDIGNNEELKILGGDGLGLTLSTNAYESGRITSKTSHKATTTSDTITRNAWVSGDAQDYTSQVLYTASNSGYCHMEFKISLGSSSPPQFAGLIKNTSSPTVSDNYQFPSMYSLSYAGSQGIRYYDGSWNPTYVSLSSTDLLSITYDETNGSGTITYKKNGTTLGTSVVGTGLTFLAKFEMYQSSYYSSELLMYNSISVLSSPIVGSVIEITPSAGTLNVAHGGTGASSFTTNGLLIGNGNSAISSGSSLTFNGSALYVDGDINATGSINASYTSDRRLKENLNIIDEPINKITKINGYYFDWITNPEIHSNTGRDVGVIAQEIKEILPEIVGERNDGYLAVRYDNIIPLLIECIKENRRDINELKNKLSELMI